MKNAPAGVVAPRRHGPQKGLETVDSINSSAAPAQSPEEQRETRECRSCYGAGMVTEDVETSYCWYEAVQTKCPICQGTGTVSVWLYPAMRRA